MPTFSKASHAGTRPVQAARTSNHLAQYPDSMPGPLGMTASLAAPWAMLPESLSCLQAMYDRHVSKPKIPIKAAPLENYVVWPGGVAVLTLSGFIFQKPDALARYLGALSAQWATGQLNGAISDPSVTAFVFSIDSPGGSVFGTPELAAAIYAAGKIKPIVVHSEAMLLSAAYWIGSAANAVYLSSNVVQVGGIGIVASHRYDPTAAGTTTEIVAGKYKRLASTNGPLSQEGHAYLQGHVDHIYSVFVDTVAANRGTSTDAVLEHMADGRVFIGQQAIDAGLADGMKPLGALIKDLARNPAAYAQRRRIAALCARGCGGRAGHVGRPERLACWRE